MKEFKLENAENANNGANLPAKNTFWGRMKNFWLQEIDLNKPVTLSPKTEKVFSEVHDFWFQEVKFSELHDFLFQEVDLSGVHDFLFQEVHLFGNKKNKENA